MTSEKSYFFKKVVLHNILTVCRALCFPRPMLTDLREAQSTLEQQTPS